MKAALAGIVAIAGLGVLALAGVFGVQAPATSVPMLPVWTEAKWPFPIDQWGSGRAFACAPSDCGVRINVFVRPKIGFCNCATGVDSDAELERVSDNELVISVAKPRGPGRPIKIGWMKGLSRAYAYKDNGVLSVAYNDECDVVVALATFDGGDPAVIDEAVVSFLGSRPMVLWAKKELGLEFVRRDW
jgi:hypothetical protein